MPLPLNFVNREFAEQTRKPAASFMRALADLYEAFALVEDENASEAQQRMNDVEAKLSDALSELRLLNPVANRWTIRNAAVFDSALDDLTEKLGFTPTGDRVVIDTMMAELEQLRSLVARHAGKQPGFTAIVPIPDDDEAQFHLMSEILRRAIRLQEIGMAVTRLSLVSGGSE